MSFTADFRDALTQAGFPKKNPDPFAITQAYREEYKQYLDPDARLKAEAGRIAFTFLDKNESDLDVLTKLEISKGETSIVCTCSGATNQIGPSQSNGASI